jgi:hypothetical protein
MHKKPPGRLDIRQPWLSPIRRLVFVAGKRRQLQRPYEVLGPVPQDPKKGHHDAGLVRQDLDFGSRLAQKNTGAAAERLDVAMVRWQVRNDPPRETPLAALISQGRVFWPVAAIGCACVSHRTIPPAPKTLGCSTHSSLPM